MAKTKQERAKEFADQMAAKLGENLTSLIVFGSTVRGGFDPGHSDLNLLFIVKDASTSALRPLEASIADWVKRRGPAPLIFTEREWQASTDVFPIEIEDMRDAHELLHGDDPFVGLTTDKSHMRHELEREIRGKLLQLRAEYAACAPDGKALTRLLIDSVGAFFVLMRATVRLVDGAPDNNPSTLVQQASQAAGLDAGAFDWAGDKIAGRTVRALKPYDPVAASYVDELEKLAQFVDQYVHQAEAQPAAAPSDNGPAADEP
jgi:predicted nucleotidyltransferase